LRIKRPSRWRSFVGSLVRAFNVDHGGRALGLSLYIQQAVLGDFDFGGRNDFAGSRLALGTELNANRGEGIVCRPNALVLLVNSEDVL
jgi:hypothetical protein